MLPEELRKRLDAKLITNGFRDYVALSEWLAGEGFEISKSALHRHGSDLERKLETLKLSTQQAQLIAKEVPDEEGAMNDALMRMYQQKLFDLMMALGDIDPDDVDVSKLGLTLARLTRASVNQKKWMREVRATLKQKVEAADAKIAEVTRTAGIAPATAQTIRNALLGIDV